jgi:hypothetical protein
MTIDALYTLVLAEKFEPGSGVVKLCCRLKGFRSMTIQADR